MVKMRNKENMAVLKVSAGSQVVKYKTFNQEDLTKLEEFSSYFLFYAAGMKDEEISTVYVNNKR